MNLYAYKLSLLKSYANKEGEGNKGTIGIPLVLNMYELLPFWHTFWTSLGYKVKVSPISSHKLYQEGQATIPSDTACYPAKLSHGHINALAKEKVDAIFYPCMSYNFDEKAGDNHYNCPVVAYYPEVLKDNCRELENIPFIFDFIDLSNRDEFIKRYPLMLQKHFPSLKTDDIVEAIHAAYKEYDVHMEDIRKKGKEIIEKARKENKHII